MRQLLVVLCILAIASPWVIYRRSQKRKLVCKEEQIWANNTVDDESQMVQQRSRRDIEVDPVHKEPIIFLGTKSNSSVFIDDGDFDVVSDHLTTEELAEVKQQILETCNALNSN